ncbi:MAG: hypothetical protein U0704_11610 [Candidatus Eisenbacteria bacterium]
MSAALRSRAAFGFLGLAIALGVVAAARARGVLPPEPAARATGVLVGLVAIVGGNDLPKLRPLAALDLDDSRAARNERAIGWLLVVAGLASAAWFAWAPLAHARAASGAFGLGCLLLAALRVVFESRGDRASGAGPEARARSPLGAWLLFGIVYLFATACVQALADGDAGARAALGWSPVAFAAVYAAVQARLGWVASHGRRVVR